MVVSDLSFNKVTQQISISNDNYDLFLMIVET